MNPSFTRRQFLHTLSVATAGVHFPHVISAAGHPRAYSILLLGDLHYDKLVHHDLAWLEKDKPDDLRQVRDYSRITTEIQPRLLATLRDTIAALNRSPETRVAFVAQVGDLVEGLCGSETLATQQNRDVLNFITQADLGAPFLFTKGNHDITGAGALDSFNKVFYPFMQRQTASLGNISAPGAGPTACWSVQLGDALFCFYDAYSRDSLPWLETTLAQMKHRQCFVLLHTPVVPYGARSTWHVFSAEKEKAERGRLLELLGSHRAIALTGHIHKYSCLVRATSGGGRFAQLSLSSVVSTPEPTPKNVLNGVAQYNGDQVKVEPAFSPATETQRRAVYGSEAPFVKHFEYADLPGYAVLHVAPDRVSAQLYAGLGRKPWRDLDLTALLSI